MKEDDIDDFVDRLFDDGDDFETFWAQASQAAGDAYDTARHNEMIQRMGEERWQEEQQQKAYSDWESQGAEWRERARGDGMPECVVQQIHGMGDYVLWDDYYRDYAPYSEELIRDMERNARRIQVKIRRRSRSQVRMKPKLNLVEKFAVLVLIAVGSTIVLLFLAAISAV